MAESNLEGVGPTLVQMSEEPTSIYVGRKVWFGLLFAYFAAIIVVQGDWFNLEETFRCFGNISTFSQCGNQQFSFPVVGVWYAFGFLFSSTFALMEFWVAQKLHKLHKQCIIEATNQASDQTASTANKDTNLEFVLDTSLWAAYIVYFVLQTTFQVIFLFILVHFQLPLLRGPIQCSTQACPGPYSCAILDRQEKWASITGKCSTTCASHSIIQVQRIRVSTTFRQKLFQPEVAFDLLILGKIVNELVAASEGK